MIFARFVCLRLLRPLQLASLAVAFAQPIAAQQPSPTSVDATIRAATATRIVKADNQKIMLGWAVSIEFTVNFDLTTDSAIAEKASSYRIINANSGVSVRVSEAKLIKIDDNPVNKVRLALNSTDALNTDDHFFVYAPDLIFGGAKAKSIPVHEIKVEVDPANNKIPPDTTRAPGINPNAKPKAAWALSASKSRDDSDIYVSYELVRARGVATTGTADLKVAIPFTKNFWNRRSTFSPLVDVKASSDAGADPDSLKFAFEWFFPLHVGENLEAKFPYTSVDLINSGKIEAPKNFNNINALWESRWLFPSAQIPGSGKPFRMFLDPFVGSEIGKNLRSPLKAAEGKGIARLMTGANLTVQVPIKNENALKQLEFTVSYIRRWPLKREISFDKDDKGNFTLVTFGKGPKDYLDSKFTVKVNDFFGPYIGYEWGRQPPDYKLVDHKWTFGLLFKSKLKAK
jgi:hypothetical protein